MRSKLTEIDLEEDRRKKLLLRLRRSTCVVLFLSSNRIFVSFESDGLAGM